MLLQSWYCGHQFCGFTVSAARCSAGEPRPVRRPEASILLTEEQCAGLNVALNEADLLGFEVNAERRMAAATFRVLTLPEIGPAPDDRRVQFLFRPVGRVAASLRDGRWDDPGAPIVPF